MSEPVPDLERLNAIGAEMLRLQKAGKWTKSEFERLLADARDAAHGAPDQTEFLYLYADPDWL